MGDTEIKKKLHRFVEVDDEKIIDLEKIKSEWYSWGENYQYKITVKEGFLYQHLLQKKEPFEVREHGATYTVYGMPYIKKIGKITGTGKEKGEITKIYG